MTTQADIGIGTTFEMATLAAPTVFTFISEIFNLTPPAFTDSTIDVTNFDSLNNTREFIAGLTEPGSASFEMNYVPGSASDIYLLDHAGETMVCRITFPNGVAITFNGVRENYEPQVPVDDRMTANVSFKVSGDPVQAAAAAPTNSVLPSISGIAQVGVLATALEGVWTGAPVFTYQWKKNAVNVAVGGTSKTYTFIAGEVGAVMTVAVTGTNGAGALTKTSAGTAAVIA